MLQVTISIGIFMLSIKDNDFIEILITIVQFGFFGYVISKKLEFEENPQDGQGSNTNNMYQKQSSNIQANASSYLKQIKMFKSIGEQQKENIFIYNDKFEELFTNSNAQNLMQSYQNDYQKTFQKIHFSEILTNDFEYVEQALGVDQKIKQFQNEYMQSQDTIQDKNLNSQGEIQGIQSINLLNFCSKMINNMPQDFEVRTTTKEVDIVNCSFYKDNDQLIVNQGYFISLKFIKNEEDYYIVVKIYENEHIIPRTLIKKQIQQAMNIHSQQCLKLCDDFMQIYDDMICKKGEICVKIKDKFLNYLEKTVILIKNEMLNCEDYFQLYKNTNYRPKHISARQTYIRHAIDEISSLSQKQMENNEIIYIQDIGVQIPEIIFTNKDQFKRLLSNLLQISILETKKGSIQMDISFYNQNTLNIDIRDDGEDLEGIERQHIKHILEGSQLNLQNYRQYLIAISNQLALSLNQQEFSLKLLDSALSTTGSCFNFKMHIKGNKKHIYQVSNSFNTTGLATDNSMFIKKNENEQQSQQIDHNLQFKLHPEILKTMDSTMIQRKIVNFREKSEENLQDSDEENQTNDVASVNFQSDQRLLQIMSQASTKLNPIKNQILFLKNQINDYSPSSQNNINQSNGDHNSFQQQQRSFSVIQNSQNGSLIQTRKKSASPPLRPKVPSSNINRQSIYKRNQRDSINMDSQSNSLSQSIKFDMKKSPQFINVIQNKKTSQYYVNNTEFDKENNDQVQEPIEKNSVILNM